MLNAFDYQFTALCHLEVQTQGSRTISSLAEINSKKGTYPYLHNQSWGVISANAMPKLCRVASSSFPHRLHSVEEHRITPNPDYKIFPARQVKKLFREPERAQKIAQNIGNPYQMGDNKNPKGAARSAAPLGRRRRRRLVVFHVVTISSVWA